MRFPGYLISFQVIPFEFSGIYNRSNNLNLGLGHMQF